MWATILIIVLMVGIVIGLPKYIGEELGRKMEAKREKEQAEAKAKRDAEVTRILLGNQDLDGANVVTDCPPLADFDGNTKVRAIMLQFKDMFTLDGELYRLLHDNPDVAYCKLDVEFDQIIVNYYRRGTHAVEIDAGLTRRFRYADLGPAGFTVLCQDDQRKIKNALNMALSWVNSESYSRVHKDSIYLSGNLIFDDLK